MVFAVSRADIAVRIAHVRLTLNHIANLESNDVPPQDSDEVRILRGLFFVHLYGAFEKSINDAVEQYRLVVNQVGVRRQDLQFDFFPVALDSWLTGLRSSGKLKKRIELVKAASDAEPCMVNPSVFSDLLQNVWSHTLLEIADATGAVALFHRQRRDEIYLDEVVDKRNAVAHGREAPFTIGSVGRSPDLTVRFDAVVRVMEAFVQMLEEHANTLGFVKPDKRASYVFP